MFQVNKEARRSGEAACRSVPVEVCGREKCPLVKGDKICWKEQRHVRNKKKIAGCILWFMALGKGYHKS